MLNFVIKSLVFLLIAFTLASPVFALGTYSISPVLVKINADEKMAGITITNESDVSARFQVESKRWRQSEGVDSYEETNDLIVSPPIFEMAPHAQQLIRVALRHRGESLKEEQLYRLMIKEMQPQIKSLAMTGKVNTLMEFNLPVFFMPTHPISKVDWILQKRGNMLQVKAVNSGNVHERVRGFKFYKQDSIEPFFSSPQFIGTVFPASTHEWRFELDKIPDTSVITMEVDTEQGSIKRPFSQ